MDKKHDDRNHNSATLLKRKITPLRLLATLLLTILTPISAAQASSPLEEEKKEIETQIEACQEKQLSLLEEIQKKEQEEKNYQNLLSPHINTIKNPNLYEYALYQQKDLEKTITTTQTNIQSRQLELATWQAQKAKYQRPQQQHKPITTQQRKKAAINRYHLQNCHDSITQLQQQIAQQQQEQHNAKKERESCYHFLQQIHQFQKNDTQPKHYNHPTNRKEEPTNRDEEKENHNHPETFFEKLYFHVCEQLKKVQEETHNTTLFEKLYLQLCAKLKKAQDEEKRLKIAIAQAQHSHNNTHLHTLYTALEANKQTIQKSQYNLEEVTKAVRQPRNTPLTFDQCLTIANHIQTLTQQKNELTRTYQELENHLDHLYSLYTTLQEINGTKEQNTRLQQTLHAIIRKDENLKAQIESLKTIQQHHRQVIATHTKPLAIDTFLLLENNILNLERKINNVTIQHNDLAKAHQTIIHKLKQYAEEAENKTQAAHQKREVAGTLHKLASDMPLCFLSHISQGIGKFAAIAILPIDIYLVPFNLTIRALIYGGALVNQYQANNLTYNLLDERDKIKHFLPILERHTASLEKLQQNLITQCQQLCEETTIPTEAITLLQNQTHYLEKQTTHIHQTAQELYKDIRKLQRSLEHLKKYPQQTQQLENHAPYTIFLQKKEKNVSTTKESNHYFVATYPALTISNILHQCSPTTQHLYKACFQEDNFQPTKTHPQQTTTKEEKEDQPTTTLDTASLTYKQAYSRLKAIEQRKNQLKTALVTKGALHKKLAKTLRNKPTLLYLEKQQQTIHQELHLLQIEQNLLKRFSQSQTIIGDKDTQLHKHAYNRQEIITACENLQNQLLTNNHRCKGLQQEIATLQVTLSDPTIKDSPILIPLLQTRIQSLIAKRNTTTLTLYGLQEQLETHKTTIQKRQRLARLLSISTGILTNAPLTLFITTTTGPFAIVLIPAASAAFSQATEDFVMNGGDNTGFQEDFCSWNTLHRTATGAVATIGTAGLVKIIPCGGKKALQAISEKTYQNLATILQQIQNDPLAVNWYTRIPTQALGHFHENFIGNITNTYVGKAFKQAIENYTGNPLRTGLPTQDPQNPNYATAHPEETWKQTFTRCAKDAAVQSIAATAANHIGVSYQSHRNNNNKRPTTTGYLLHKSAHLVLGATIAVLQKRLVEGKTNTDEILHAALSGGTGALVAEVVAEAHKNHFGSTLEGIVATFDAQEREYNAMDVAQAYNNEIHHSGKVGKLAAICNAYFLDHDIEVAHRASKNAIDNNFLVTTTLVAGALLFEYLCNCNREELTQLIRQGLEIWEAAEESWESFKDKYPYSAESIPHTLTAAIAGIPKGDLASLGIGVMSIGLSIALEHNLPADMSPSMARFIVQAPVAVIGTCMGGMKGLAKIAIGVPASQGTEYLLDKAFSPENVKPWEDGMANWLQENTDLTPDECRKIAQKSIATGTTLMRAAAHYGVAKAVDKGVDKGWDAAKKRLHRKSAYDIAKEGGKNKRELENYEKRTDKELKKSINSHKKTIEEHEALIRDPETNLKKYGKTTGKNASKYKNYKTDSRYRDAQPSRWAGDIQRAKEKIEILEGILRNRK